QVSLTAKRIESFVVDGGRAARPVAPDIAFEGEDRPNRGRPKLFAGLIQTDDDLIISARTKRVQLAADNRETRKTEAGVAVGPQQLGTCFGPRFQEVAFAGNSAAIRTAPLRPIGGANMRSGNDERGGKDTPKHDL